MKILVLGANGMAGHIVSKYLNLKNYAVTTFARNNAEINYDVCDIRNIEIFFKNNANTYDFIINCIGLLVKASNDNPAEAALINSWFPHMIERSIKSSNTKLIHLSTDCVFDGNKGFYVENDLHTEKNFYGKSKSLGEINNDKDITFRMSIIGPELKSNGTGLFNWFYNTNDVVNGWSNALWNGITTLQLAKCIELYINDPKINGIYHVVNNDNFISKYDLLVKINEIFDLKKSINQIQGPKRINKILKDTRNEFDFKITSYNEQISDMRDFMQKYN